MYTGIILAVVAIVLGGIGYYWWTLADRKSIAWKEKSPFSYEVPNQGNIHASFVVGVETGACTRDAVVDEEVLRLIRKGVLEVKTDADPKLILHPERMNEEPCGKALLELLQGAAAESPDPSSNQLSIAETKAYGKAHYKQVREFVLKCLADGDKYMADNGHITSEICEIRKLTKSGEAEFKAALGVRRMVRDFEKAKAAEKASTPEEYLPLLPYAVLFGYTDEFEESLKNAYGEKAFAGECAAEFENARWAVKFAEALAAHMVLIEQTKKWRRGFIGGFYLASSTADGFDYGKKTGGVR